MRPLPALYAEGFIVYELDPVIRSDQAMVAFATNLLVASAAYDEAVQQRPRSALQLRHRARIICQMEEE